MSRRPDPARIREARRSAIHARLVSDGLHPEQADRWLSDWAERAGEPETPAEFEAAYEWIVSELAGGARLRS